VVLAKRPSAPALQPYFGVTTARQIAEFSRDASWTHLSDAARSALKMRLLDAAGCAFAALDAEPIRSLRAFGDDLGGLPRSALIGGGRTSPDRAAFFNAALVRYLDFNDAYLAPRETCHPSDNVAAVLAAAEAAQVSGSTLLTALAVAYQVQCRLSDEAPLRDRGFDHTTQGACAVAAGCAKALGLDLDRTANAVAIATVLSPALRVTRTGELSNWKGLASAHASFAAIHATLLAARGITGPPSAFEGRGGFMDTLSGPFSIDWAHEDLERVTMTSAKRFNSEVHAQSAVEAIIEIATEFDVRASAIRQIEVDIFDVAFRIIGGGDGSDRKRVRTKEQADHSLPYLLAVAALDRQLMPAQFEAARISKPDVQELLGRVVVREDPAMSARFPHELPCRVRVRLADDRCLEKQKSDYVGFFRNPSTWRDVRAKFDTLATAVPPQARDRIASAVADLENLGASTLGSLLSLETPS
jgi:2-methylcitrate dehydratase